MLTLLEPVFLLTSAALRLGKHFGMLKASDMILVDYDGKAIGGNMSRPANAAGFLIHSAVHKARPDVVCPKRLHILFDCC